MSEKGAQRSGINRAFSWLKRTLQITEPTDSPDRLSPLVQPTMDLFGWERLVQQEPVTVVGALASDTVLSAVVPEGVFRLVVDASLTHDDIAIGGRLWFEHRIARLGPVDVGVGNGTPVSLPAAGITVKHGLGRWLLLAPGDSLLGRSFPTPGAAEAITMLISSVDISEGEYIASMR